MAVLAVFAGMAVLYYGLCQLAKFGSLLLGPDCAQDTDRDQDNFLVANSSMSIAESMQAEWDRGETERSAWGLGEYTGASCPNCGRERLCVCPNGKTRCEKCNWVVEDGDYCPLGDSMTKAEVLYSEANWVATRIHPDGGAQCVFVEFKDKFGRLVKTTACDSVADVAAEVEEWCGVQR
jgi:hypothetical protein